MRNLFFSAGRVRWLLLCCAAGLLTGTCFSAPSDPVLISMMRRAAVSPVSIVMLTVCSILPFLIAAYAVVIDRYIPLFLIAALRCFGYSYCAAAAKLGFGTAGWLVQPMLQFTDTLGLLLLILLCIRWCSGRTERVRRDTALSVIIVAAAAVVDFALVSPFLAEAAGY